MESNFFNCKVVQFLTYVESASELYRPTYRRFEAKLVPNFADVGCCVVCAADSYGRILGFLDGIDLHLTSDEQN
jgi:hypothetical protein